MLTPTSGALRVRAERRVFDDSYSATPVIEVAGERVAPLLDPRDGRLGCARSEGPVRIASTSAVAWVVAEHGNGTIDLDGSGPVFFGRTDVFAAPGWSAVVAAGSTVQVAGDIACAVVWRGAGDFVETSRVIDPAAVRIERRGDGATTRTVRTYIAEGPLIVGETLNPAGGWSSWPPHTHLHEELYLYRFDPADGFGVHVDLEGSPTVVRDGDVVRITSGEHPVVAAPGSAMYYLWALAGATGTLDTRVDPRWRD